ncbi:phage tail family protein [Bacillus cereus]|uniref:phage tail family protein n=1 Tax=Bacillus cereus TaxID=1396 RepID=UPI00103B740D|nr:phage tail family protein [Bacillus cereus]TBX83969.1 phage tail family protein [Bacillus cereus]
MSLLIQKINGVQRDTADFGLRLIEFDPDSPDYNIEYDDGVKGRDGAIDVGTTVRVRKLNARFNLSARDMYDIALLRNEIFQLFHSKEEFYIIDQREPGKRWRVKVDPYTIRTLKYVKTEVNLRFTAAFPYAESIGKTTDPMTFDSNLWQIGQGLIAEDTKYHHTTTSFRIYNAGDVTIDPRSMPLKIKYKGKSNNLTIKNNTTGDLWNYAGTTTTLNDVITLDGVRAYRNVLGSIFKNTNWGLITLKPGWNDFILTGAIDAFEVEFDFQFYYL